MADTKKDDTKKTGSEPAPKLDQPKDKKESELPPPASEAQVSHAHEMADDDTARKGQETAAEAERRKNADPLGRQKAAEDQDEADAEVEASLRKRGGKDTVKVTMIRTVDAPIVGRLDMRRELGIQQLQQGKSYSVPAAVAAVLVDHKHAITPD